MIKFKGTPAPKTTPDDYLGVKCLLEYHNWTYAKSMPKWPHFWSARSDWESSDDFTYAAQFIIDNGVKEPWGNRPPLTYLYLNGYRYWTMGNGAEKSTIINRNKPNYHSDYDAIAGGYDFKYATKPDLEENRRLFKTYPLEGRVLDIGCGTGLAVEWGKTNPANYVGIDPSMAMLQVFMTKHPEYAMSLRCSKFEDYYDEGFDTILGLFGAAGYIAEEHFARIKGMLNPGGKAYIMDYKQGHVPHWRIPATEPPCLGLQDATPFSHAYNMAVIHA